MSNQGGGGGSSNRWDVMSIREYTDRTNQTKTQWTKIGVAFTNKNGSINVQLDCLPLDGKMQLQVPLTKEEKDRLFGNRQGGQREEQRQNQNHRPHQGQGYGQSHNPRNAGAQQRASNAQRYGQRGPSQPQGGFGRQPQGAPPQYEPEPQDPGYDEGGGGEYQEQGWDVNGVWITDPKQLPPDHHDYIPF